MSDAQQETPAACCPRCRGEIYRGETVYEWDGRKGLCSDCFRSCVEDLLKEDPVLLAALLGLDTDLVGGPPRGAAIF